MKSPAWMPASAAGEPALTMPTKMPSAEGCMASCMPDHGAPSWVVSAYSGRTGACGGGVTRRAELGRGLKPPLPLTDGAGVMLVAPNCRGAQPLSQGKLLPTRASIAHIL